MGTGLRIEKPSDWDVVRNNPELPWPWADLSQYIPFDVALAHKDKIQWIYLGDDRFVTLGTVKAHPEINWNWYGLSESIYVANLATVTANPNMPWKWGGLSRNINITPEFVTANIDKDWDWDELAMNPSMTTEFLIKYKKCDWRFIAHNDFSADPKIQKRNALRILRKWRAITIERATHRKELFEPVMDVFRLRIRDVKEGVTRSLLTVPKRLL